MSAEKITLIADSAHVSAEHSAVVANGREPIFWLALLCAAGVHAALIVGISSSSPRFLGELGGSPDVINVELIDEAEFQSGNSVATLGGSPPGAPATASPPPRPNTARPSEAVRPQQSADLQPLEMEKPDLNAPPDATAERSVTEFAPDDDFQPPKQLDLTVPFDSRMQAALSGAVGRSSSAVRPPGITRSGENDEFGRGVIRGLKKTMPPPNEVKGRVTIRIFLNEQGNIAKLELVQGSGNRELDQNVIFSARQAVFPFPPDGATVADRTFRITYVYR